MNKEDLLKYFDQDKDLLLDICKNLIKIPSENPGGDSLAISKYIKDLLEEYGIEVEVHKSADKMINLIAKIGNDEGKNLIYCGHSDTVPVGDRSKWEFDPFEGEIVDGILRGRGASDMKCGLGGLIFSLIYLKKHNIDINGSLTLAVVPDEETGTDFGVPYLFENKLLKGDGALIAEPSGDLNPTIGQKGSGAFTLTVYGEPGHGSLAPLSGKSAIENAILAINKLRGYTDKKIEVPEELEELIEVSKQYVIEKEVNGEKLAQIFERCSFNLGVIKGGTARNVIADKCLVEIDSRLPFGIERDKFLKDVKDILNSLDIEYDFEESGFKSNANYTPAEDPICKYTVDNISYVKNQKAYGVLQWACSDARYFRQNNIPVLQYGPAILETIHGFNERAEVQDIIDCAKVYILTAVDFLNEDK